MGWRKVQRKKLLLLLSFFPESGLDIDYFRRVTTNSDKYGWYHLKNGKFGGMKWINIPVQGMIYLYGVMLIISIEPRNLGGYTSYFESISRIICGQG